MDPSVIVWLGLGGSVAAVAIGAFVRDRLRVGQREREARRLATFADGLPHRAIAEVKDGEAARVVGTIHAGPTLESPLGGEPVVAYHAALDLLTKGLPSLLAEERLAIDFVIEDGTARARLAAARASILGTPVRIHPPEARVRRFLDRRGIASTSGLVPREIGLRVGARVEIAGRARWEPDPDPDRSRPDASYRGSAEPRRLVFDATPDAPVVVRPAPPE